MKNGEVSWHLYLVLSGHNMNSSIQMHNTCRLILSDKAWNVISETIRENITCDAGRTSLIQRLFDDTTSELGKIKYIAVWISTATPTVGRTQLVSENIRAAIDPTRTTNSGTQVKVYARFWTGTALTVTEAWVFVDASATLSPNTGALLCYSTGWAAIVKPTTQVLTIEWTIAMVNATV